jgi:hypothetical protein
MVKLSPKRITMRTPIRIAAHSAARSVVTPRPEIVRAHTECADCALLDDLDQRSGLADWISTHHEEGGCGYSARWSKWTEASRHPGRDMRSRGRLLASPRE